MSRANEVTQPADSDVTQPPSITDAFRPKLRSDALWVPQDDGVFLLCNASSITIRGKSSYELVDRLAPYLDGSRDMVQLTHGMRETVATQVRNLVRNLRDSGFVRDIGVDREHGLSAAELEDFSGELAFIEYFCDSPAARYEAFRDTPILCVGSGLTFEGLVRAFVQLGNRRLTAVVCDGGRRADLVLDQVLDRARQRDYNIDVDVVTAPASHPSTRSALHDLITKVTYVVQLADALDQDLASFLDEECRRAGKVVLHGAVNGDNVFLGPLCEKGTSHRGPAVWESLRVSGQSARSPFLAAPTARIVASQLAFEVFKHATGVPADDFRDRVVQVDLATLATEEIDFSPATTAPPPDVEAKSTWSASLPATPTELSRLSRTFAQAVDLRRGPVRSVDEGDLAQLPLRVCRAEGDVEDQSGRRVMAVGSGLDLASARLGAVLAMAESASVAAESSRATVKATRLLTARTVDLPGEVLTNGRLVEAASDVDPSSATARALGRVVRRLLRDQPMLAASAPAPLATDTITLRLRKMLAAAGHEVDVRIVLDLPGFVIARATSSAGLTGVGVSSAATTAVTDALYDAACGLHDQVNGQILRTDTVADATHLARVADSRTNRSSTIARIVHDVIRPMTSGAEVAAVELTPHSLLDRGGLCCVAVVAYETDRGEG